MHVGADVYKIVDGVAFSGKVTELNEDSLTFVTADGNTIFAAKGEAHRFDKLHHLSEIGFTTTKPSYFELGFIVAHKDTGVITQITNVDISGAVTTQDGTISSDPSSVFVSLGPITPYKGYYSNVDSDDELDEDDDALDEDEDEDSE